MLSDRDICKILNFLGKSGIGDTTELELRVKAIESIISDEENPSEAIDKFNEIVEFLKDILNTKELKLILDLKADLSDIPTNVSAFDNDVPYLTEDDLKVEEIDANGHDYVEIAGIKWATMNVGASSETEAGLYFLWGDTQGYTASQVGNDSGKKEFNWTDYKWSDNGSNYVFTKYNNTDGKTVLDLEDDAVAANWGGSWRMPTTEEIQALREAVNAVWTTNYNGSGIDGLLCTDKTDSSKKLFFPAVSFANNGMVEYVGEEGYVWSSSLDSEYVSRAWNLSFYSGNTAWDETHSRLFGLSVRGVLDTGMVDKYATKQELNAETLRAQTVEATKANTADLATVATTGSYNDLTDKPTYSEVGAADSQLVFGTNFSQAPIFPYIHIQSNGDILIQNRFGYGSGETVHLRYDFPAMEELYNQKMVRIAGITSPALEGTPTAPTAATGTNTTQIATTAFVLQETTNMVESSTVRNVVVLTLAEYDDLTTKDPNTEYNIIETV